MLERLQSGGWRVGLDWAGKQSLYSLAHAEPTSEGTGVQGKVSARRLCTTFSAQLTPVPGTQVGAAC